MEICDIFISTSRYTVASDQTRQVADLLAVALGGQTGALSDCLDRLLRSELKKQGGPTGINNAVKLALPKILEASSHAEEMMEVLTTEEAAQFLGVSRTHVNSLVDANVLPASRTTGDHRRIPKAAVVEYKQKMKARQARGLEAIAEASSAMGLYEGELEGIPRRSKRKA